MSTVRSLPRSRAGLRALVLLLVLLVPGAHTGAHAVPTTAVASGETSEHDGLDTALRPPARAAHRPVAPVRPAPLPRPAPGTAQSRTPSAPVRTAYAPNPLRCVVLRC
ncbi:hypothetical protein ACIO93_29570 [Streptomyces sp. NPDC087903]|uniref:hypothetical protein n=1 Tax=Streptomyces sp. NPDC087903 TaxID=3365819 RepID=UPI0038104DB4